jgi:hypothetical protein
MLFAIALFYLIPKCRIKPKLNARRDSALESGFLLSGFERFSRGQQRKRYHLAGAASGERRRHSSMQ